MRKTLILNSNEIITLISLAEVNNDILLNGLTKDNTEELLELQFELVRIVHKVHKFSK